MNKILNFNEWNSSIKENSKYSENTFENRKKRSGKLYEQAKTEQSKYGEYKFGGTFPGNYIEPSPASYKPIMTKMTEDLKKAVSEGKKLTDIKIVIQSSASALNATNRYKGATPPNHNFGGLMKTKWVSSGQDFQVVPGGNEFLAKNRGLKMKEVLVKELAAMGISIPEANISVKPRPDGKWVSDSKDESEQYVNVLIEGMFEKTPVPEEKKYPYSIIYSWYKIGESNVPYVLIDGIEGDAKLHNKGVKHGQYGRGITKVSDKFKEAVANSGDDVKIAGYSRHIGNPNIENSGEYQFFAFANPLSGYVDANSKVFFYDDEQKWLEDVKKVNLLNPSGPFGMQKQKENKAWVEFKIDDNKIYAKGKYIPGKSGHANFEHGDGRQIDGNTLYVLKGKELAKADDKGKVKVDNIYSIKDAQPVIPNKSNPSTKSKF